MTQYSKQEEMKKVQETAGVEPEDVLDMQVKKEAIVKAIGRLSKKYREIVVMYYYQQMDIHDISRQLHLSNSATDVRLHRARKRLRELLRGTL